jgi:hypothetical protein
MAEVLYVPNREQVVTTNVWAFLYWLRTTRHIQLRDWTSLQEWSVSEPSAFVASVVEFAGEAELPDSFITAEGKAASHTKPLALAESLLFADLRPNDRICVVEGNCPDPIARAAQDHATVLVGPAQLLANAAFPHRGRRNLADLRMIVSTGGPMSPEARRRIYTWVKADVMLLACGGHTYWGNALEPVLAQPPATPAFLTQRPSAPQPR